MVRKRLLQSYINLGLTHFMPLVSLNTPLKYQKTRGFLIFSGGIARDQWHEMGQEFQLKREVSGT